MNAFAAGSLALAGALAAIPTTAIAYSLPAHGKICIPKRWWRGEPARPTTVVAASILTGATTGLIADTLSPSPILPAFWLFAVVGVGLAVTDLRRHRLPHVMTGTLWISCSGCAAAESLATGRVHSLAVAASAGAAVTALGLVIALALPGQLGLGDVSLSGVIALSLGSLSLHTATVGLLSGVTIQATFSLTKILVSRDRLSLMPFGPALLLGWLVAILDVAL